MGTELLYVALLSVGAAIVMFILTKVMGDKQISQMSIFDYIIGITLGSVAAEMATNLENPLKPLLSMIIFGLLAVGLTLLNRHSIRLRKVFDGRPILLLDNGILYRENFKKARLELNEFLATCRVHGYFDLSQLQTAMLEHNGNISFLPVSDSRPATPADHSLSPPQEHLVTNIIVDGRALLNNLKKAGKDERWLEKQLKENKLSRSDVFLATLDAGGVLKIYRMNRQKNMPDPFE